MVSVCIFSCNRIVLFLLAAAASARVQIARTLRYEAIVCSNIIECPRDWQLAAFMHAAVDGDGPQITSSQQKQFLWVFNIFILPFCNLRPIEGPTIRRNSIYGIQRCSNAALVWFWLLVFFSFVADAFSSPLRSMRQKSISIDLFWPQSSRFFFIRVDTFAIGIVAWGDRPIGSTNATQSISMKFGHSFGVIGHTSASSDSLFFFSMSIRMSNLGVRIEIDSSNQEVGNNEKIACELQSNVSNASAMNE